MRVGSSGDGGGRFSLWGSSRVGVGESLASQGVRKKKGSGRVRKEWVLA